MEPLESLCMVAVKDDGNTLYLQRFADIVNGRVYPFRAEPTQDQNQENRCRIYYPKEASPMPLHGIAVYSWKDEWHDESDRWEQSPTRINSGWTEAILTSANSMEELLTLVQQGIVLLQSCFTDQHGLLFVLRPYFEKTIGLYVPYESFTCSNGRVSVKDDVTELKRIAVYPGDICACRSLLNVGDTKYYYALNPYDVDGETIRICSIYDDIRRVIKGHKKELFETIGRTGAKTITRFLDELPVSSLAEELAVIRNCSTEEAKQLFLDAFEGGMDSLNVDGESGTLLQSFVEHDAELCRLLANLVEEQWRKKSKELLADAQREQQEMQKELSATRAELKTVQTRIISQTAALAKLDNKVADRTSVIDSLDAALQSRLDTARRELGTLLADYAFLLPERDSALAYENEKPKAVAVSHVSLAVSDVREEARVLPSIESLRNTISSNLNAAGVGQNDKAQMLAAYLLGAFVRRTNIILCGFGGHDIVCALSSACCGSNPALLSISEQATPQEIAYAISDCDTPIVVIADAFTKRPEPYLLAAERCDEHMIVFLSPFEENMTAEPIDIYRYALPLLLSHFINNTADRDFVYALAPEGLLVDRKKGETDERYCACIQDSYICGTIAGIERSIQTYLPSVEADIVCCAAGWIPLAFCIGKKAQMEELVKEKGFIAFSDSEDK